MDREPSLQPGNTASNDNNMDQYLVHNNYLTFQNLWLRHKIDEYEKIMRQHGIHIVNMPEPENHAVTAQHSFKQGGVIPPVSEPPSSSTLPSQGQQLVALPPGTYPPGVYPPGFTCPNPCIGMPGYIPSKSPAYSPLSKPGDAPDNASRTQIGCDDAMDFSLSNPESDKMVDFPAPAQASMTVEKDAAPSDSLSQKHHNITTEGSATPENIVHVSPTIQAAQKSSPVIAITPNTQSQVEQSLIDPGLWRFGQKGVPPAVDTTAVTSSSATANSEAADTTTVETASDGQDVQIPATRFLKYVNRFSTGTQMTKRPKFKKNGIPSRPWVFGYTFPGTTEYALYYLTCPKMVCPAFKTHPLVDERGAQHIRACGGEFQDEAEMVRKFGTQIAGDRPTITLDWARKWNHDAMATYGDLHLVSENFPA